MSDLKTVVGGVRYLCKNSGTCVAYAAMRADVADLVFRCFVEVGKKIYNIS
jgi:hypothetical protein